MAATKKKAAKKPAKKAAKKAAKKKQAAKKAAKASVKAPAKKAAKKAAKAPAKAKASAKTQAKGAPKAPDKKAAPKKKSAAKTPAKKEAKKPAKDAAKKAEAKTADAKSKKKPAAPSKTSKKAGKKPKPRKAVTPTGPRHPKLGYKWVCFACGAKFYDLGHEQPLCPRCETDQRERPPDAPKAPSESPKPKVVRPMAQLLDDEEPQPSAEEDLALEKKPASPAEEMFDDTGDGDGGGLDIEDEGDTQEGVDPPEIDEL